jgi:hypothetical protein
VTRHGKTVLVETEVIEEVPQALVWVRYLSWIVALGDVYS